MNVMNVAFNRRGFAVTCAVIILLGLPWAAARFEWRDLHQVVTIESNGDVVVIDERTLWTPDEDFGEAFICVGHPEHVRLTLLDGSGAISPGPEAVTFQQPCAAGTEVVVRNAQRVRERRVRFIYRLRGTVDAYTDVVQWYWNLIQLDHPPIVGYRLSVAAPGPMTAPYDAYVMKYGNPEAPRVALSPDRSVLTVKFDLIPHGDGVEIRFLMDPQLFTLGGTEPGLRGLQSDQARISRGSAALPVGLHAAVAGDDYVAVAGQIRSGADPNSRDPEGRTPLMVAARESGNVAIIEALIAAGANAHSRDSDGFTPLHFASSENPNPDIVRALLAAGSDISARSNHGLTPLMVAASENPHTRIHELLLRQGANPDDRADYGITALMLAARNSAEPDVITVLLEAGADATASDGAGNRAIDYARANPSLQDTPAYWRLNDASFD